MGEVRKNILNRALLNPITVYSGGVPVAGYAADKLADAVAKAGEAAGYTAESKIVKWSATLSKDAWAGTEAVTIVIDCGMGFKPSVTVTYQTGIGAFSKAEQMSRLINEQCGKYGLRCGILGTSGDVTGIEIAAIDCMGFTVTMNEAFDIVAGTPTVTTADVMDLPARTTSIAVTASGAPFYSNGGLVANADCTGIIRVGDRISFTNNAGTTVYHTVTGVSSDGLGIAIDRPATATTAKTVTCHTPLNLRGPEIRLGPGEYTGDVELFGGMRVIGTEAVFAGTSWKIMPGHKAHWSGVRFKPATNMSETYRVDYVDGKVSLPEWKKLGPRSETAMSQAARVALLMSGETAQNMDTAYWPLDRAATPATLPAVYMATKCVPLTIPMTQQKLGDATTWASPIRTDLLRRATRNAGYEVAAAQHAVTAAAFTDILGMIREVLCPKTYIEQLSDNDTTDAAIISEMAGINQEISSDPASYRPLGLAARGFIPPSRRGAADMDTMASQESCSGFYGKLVREAYEWSLGWLQNQTALPLWDNPHGMVVENLSANIKQGWLQSAIAAASWTKPDGATSAVAVGSDWRTAVAADGREYVKVGDYIGNDFHGWLEVSAVNETSITCTGQWETTFTGHSGTSFQLWNRTRMYEYLTMLSVPRRKSILYAPVPPTNAAAFHCFKAFVDKLSELSLAGTLIPTTVTTLVNTQFPAVDNAAASLAQDWDVDLWDTVDPLPGSGVQQNYRGTAMRFNNAAHFAIVEDGGVNWIHMDNEAAAVFRKGVWVQPGRSYRWRWKMKDSAGDGSVLVHVSIGAALHRGDVWETVSKWHCLRHTKVTAVGSANYELVVGANGLLQVPEYAVNGLVKLEIWIWRNSGATDIRDLVLEYA